MSYSMAYSMAFMTTRRWVPLLLAAVTAAAAALLPPRSEARAQAAAAAAAAAAPKPPTNATARTLLALEDRWAAAVVKRDGATFERLLAPGFVYTENDQVMSRADVIKSVTSGSDTVTAARNEGLEVHRYGPTTAVVTGWLVMQGRGPSGAFDRRYRFTDTWVKSGAQWRIVAAQDYLK